MATSLEQNIGKANDSPVGNSQSEKSQLSAKTFSDPKDFLNTLQTHFKELARGDNKLTLPNLQLDAKDANLDTKTRAAASMAAEHFSDLAGIHKQADGGSQENSKGISANDVKFASAMNDHNTKSYTEKNVDRELESAVQTAGLGSMNAAVLATVFADPAAALAAAAVGVGVAGYFGYQAYKENDRMKSIANKDSTEFHGWTQT